MSAVLRQAETLGPEPRPVPTDADLLGRVASREAPGAGDAAFAELVRRHGAAVWAACRHLLLDPADAEDAFQVTFLALARSGHTIRSGAAVGGWLHGVAVRTATELKRTAARRRRRERGAAAPEREYPVPDSAWAAVLAAVHEEVGRLPGPLRTAVVLCDLEGVPQPDAAARLGWKPGTLTGRLSRARRLLHARLTDRGLAPAVAAGALATGTGVTAVPAHLVSIVVQTAFGEAPPALLKLATEMVPMTLNRMKLCAVGLVAIGLMVGLGPLVLSGAGAQPPRAAAPAPAPGVAAAPTYPVSWEYKFVARGLPPREFVGLFVEMGRDGWEFCGYYGFDGDQIADATKAHPDALVVQPGSTTALMFKRAIVPGRTRGPGVAEKQLQVVVLRHADASETAEVLRKVFGADVSATPDTRTNALIIRAEKGSLEEALRLLDRLDAVEGPRKK